MNTRIQIDRTGNRYCGPLVLAAIFGTTTAEAAERVRHHTGGYAVKGMTPGRMLATLAGHNVRVLERIVPKYEVTCFGRKLIKGPTLATWLRSREPGDMDKTFLILITGHYVLVKGRKFVDTFTKGEWVFIRRAPHRRARVVRVWQVTE